MNATKLTFVTFIGLSLVCLLVGSIGGMILFDRVNKSNFRMQLANNKQYGERFANALRTQLRHGYTQEQILGFLQESFESAPGDRSRYLCVVTQDGRLLCHPEGGIIGSDVNTMAMYDYPSRDPLSYREWVEQGLVEGLFADEEGKPTELVRRIRVESTPWDVIVHTRLEAIMAESRAINRTILMVMVPMGVMLVLFGTVVARSIGRRYETAIEANNRLLEQRVLERTAELDHTIAQLREAHDALLLREKLALMGQLVAGIAHEINSPLAAIRVTADVLAEDAAEKDQRDAALQISRSAQRCSLLVSNLLSFARRDAPQVAPTPVNEVVEVSLSFCMAELQKGGVKLIRELSPENPILPLDRVQLEQAVLNLVNNAFQAFRPEAPEKVIRVGTALAELKVVISVEDNGPGISSTMVPKLFEPFHTTKTTGTGLGLSLCKRFVESHGGTIMHRRSKLGGAEFLIEIPMRPAILTASRTEEPAFIG